MYSIKLDDSKEKKTGKGIKKSVLKTEVRYQDFKDCLFLRQDYEHTMVNFRSQHHQLFTIKQTKTSLSPFDDKRYILEDGCTITESHAEVQEPVEMTQSHIDVGEFNTTVAPPSSNGFYSYLNSFWNYTFLDVFKDFIKTFFNILLRTFSILY